MQWQLLPRYYQAGLGPCHCLAPSNKLAVIESLPAILVRRPMLRGASCQKVRKACVLMCPAARIALKSLARRGVPERRSTIRTSVGQARFVGSSPPWPAPLLPKALRYTRTQQIRWRDLSRLESCYLAESLKCLGFRWSHRQRH